MTTAKKHNIHHNHNHKHGRAPKTPPKDNRNSWPGGKKGHFFGSPEATRRAMEVPVSPLGWGMVPATVTRIWYLCANHSARNSPKGAFLGDLTGFASPQFRRFPAFSAVKNFFKTKNKIRRVFQAYDHVVYQDDTQPV